MKNYKRLIKWMKVEINTSRILQLENKYFIHLVCTSHVLISRDVLKLALEYEVIATFSTPTPLH